MVQSVERFFAELSLNPRHLAGMNAVYQFDLTGDGGGTWHIRIADGAVEIGMGHVETPNITLTAAADQWLAIVNGEVNGRTAFLAGKLKLKGDLSLAMTLPDLIRDGTATETEGV